MCGDGHEHGERREFARVAASGAFGPGVAAGEAGLAYAQISASPYIGSGLAPATPLRLARTLLDERDLPANAEEGEA